MNKEQHEELHILGKALHNAKDRNGCIKAKYYGNSADTCMQIISSYLYFSGFDELIEEHPTAECNSCEKDISLLPNGKYEALGCFTQWWNEYISDEEGNFVEEFSPEQQKLFAQFERYFDVDVENCTMTHTDWILNVVQALTDNDYGQTMQKLFKEQAEEYKDKPLA
jgi:hypothetical protein